MKTHIITSWRAFDKTFRPSQERLLNRVPCLRDDLIFVAGCQRSGTTILTNVLMRSPVVNDYRTKLDSELEGALILAGALPDLPSVKRSCFQTTYLNQSYGEYFEHKGRFKLVCVVRNPFSVVYSMVYHWKRRRDLRIFALNELFNSVGKNGLKEKEKQRFEYLGAWGVSRIRKACLSYAQKTAQIFEIKLKLGDDVMVVEYDDMVQNKNRVLPQVYSFFDMAYEPSYGSIVNPDSLGKANGLCSKERRVVEETCLDIYDRAKAMAG